jgi:peptidoglycan hydrolase CwlO-like protein
MSQFNQTSSQTPNSPGKKNNSIIYWVIILVLLTACIFLFWDRSKRADENAIKQKQQQQTIDSVKTDRAALQSDFDAASAKIDQLVSQNSKLDSALQGDKVAMAKLQSQIKTILANKNATKEELAKARDMITSLTDKTKQYEARIAELEKENTKLTGENKVLTKERDSTVTTNIALKKAGSVLHASNIRMDAIHNRRNGKERETSKAKKVDVLRITFDIDENRIAESGTKQVYVRIIAPDGSVLSSPSNASGKMNTVNAGQLGYSVLKDIMLTQNQPVKDISVDWNQDGDYGKGTYTIEIFNEGYKVGSGTVTLR